MGSPYMLQHTNIVILFGIPFYKKGVGGGDESGGWDVCVWGIIKILMSNK